MQHFNNYTIIKQIGEGGMATVYLAIHNSLKHQVAIKVLNKEFVFNSNIRSRFTEEAKKMVRMNHINVVKVTDLIDDENTVAIVMEYVQGKTLKQILEEKKLKDDDIEFYFKQMAKALEYVHSQGLIHRDIKPSNFILSNDGYLKLTDFGISKSLDTENIENTQTGTTVSLGTPMYMSPEQVRSTKDVTFLTDIYSLGVVLWEMASGKKPYSDNTLSIFDLQLKIVQERLPLTNTKWDKQIITATQKEESYRYKSANRFLIEVNNGFEGDVDNEKFNIISHKIKGDTKIKDFNKRKYVLLSLVLISFIIAMFFIFFRAEKEHVKNVQQDVKKSNIEIENDKKLKEKIKLQYEIDSLKLISAQNIKDSLKLAAELKEKNKVKIGDYFQGGIVCKIDNLGKHGLVCSSTDLGRYNLDDAISICNNYSNDGYSDWYLPSEEELRIVYHKLCKRNVINFSGDRYWYKFENYIPTDDYSLNGFCDFQNWECELIDKRASLNVRAIRKF